jgi:hypothetical protein
MNASQVLGTAMIIRYGDSPAGAYDELLIALPVKTPVLQKEYMAPRAIPLIYVSSESSLRNGRKNWGIRKENANFEFEETAGWLTSTTSVKITDRYSGELILDASLGRYSVVLIHYSVNFSIPIHLGFLGSLIPLIVERSIDEEGNLLGNQWLLTRMSGYGKNY